MDREYNGYTIRPEGSHYIVVDEDGKIVTRADSIEEAKQEIDELEE